MAFFETLEKGVVDNVKPDCYNAAAIYEFAKLYNNYHMTSMLKLNNTTKSETRADVIAAIRNKVISKSDKLFADAAYAQRLSDLSKKIYNACYYTRKDPIAIIKKAGKKSSSTAEAQSLPDEFFTGDEGEDGPETKKSTKPAPTNLDIMKLMNSLNEKTNTNIENLQKTSVLNTEKIEGLAEKVEKSKNDYDLALKTMQDANKRFEAAQKESAENKKAVKDLDKKLADITGEMQKDIDKNKTELEKKIEELTAKFDEKMSDFEARLAVGSAEYDPVLMKATINEKVTEILENGRLSEANIKKLVEEIVSLQSDTDTKKLIGTQVKEELDRCAKKSGFVTDIRLKEAVDEQINLNLEASKTVTEDQIYREYCEFRNRAAAYNDAVRRQKVSGILDIYILDMYNLTFDNGADEIPEANVDEIVKIIGCPFEVKSARMTSKNKAIYTIMIKMGNKTFEWKHYLKFLNAFCANF